MPTEPDEESDLDEPTTDMDRDMQEITTRKFVLSENSEPDEESVIDDPLESGR